MSEKVVKKNDLDADVEALDERLAPVLEQIDRDARDRPDQYLRDTEVPAGGE